MKYIYNKDGFFCGVCFSDKIGGIDATDVPVKPLRPNEKAFWNGEKWEYSFDEEEKIEGKDFLNGMIDLFNDSRMREPLGVYNEDDYIVIGDKTKKKNLDYRMFDCVFLGRINFHDIEDFLCEKNMVLRKHIWEEIKDMSKLGKMKTLLSKYACFVSGTEWQDGEKPTVEELISFEGETHGDIIANFLTNTEITDVLFQATLRMIPGGGAKTIPKEENITILIPCYNKAEYIMETVESAVNQTLFPCKVKVLLMDDESIALKDEIESLASFVECEVHKRLNASAARNYLVKKCETEYFILLDADDILDENFVEEVYKMDASIVFPDWNEMNFPEWKHTKAESSLFRECVGQNLTSLLCKTVWNELGGLDEDLCQGGEDADFIIRLFCETKWRIQKTFKTKLNYRRGLINALTSKKEFFSSHFRQLVKNKEIIRREMKKSYFLEDDFTRFFFNDYNFTSEKTMAFKFAMNRARFYKAISLCQFVTFEMHKDMCNRKCVYCTQEGSVPNVHLDDDKVFEQFDKMLSKVEEVTGGKFHVQIMGGEATLWSDSLIQKILDRLKDKQVITVVTNHDKKDSLWESDSRVAFYTHLCDWQTMGKIDLAANNRYMIVVTHDDIKYLEDFMRENSDTLIAIDEYIGEDDTMKLTDEDRKTITSLVEKYPDVDPRWLSPDGTTESEGYKISAEECRKRMNIWRADCDAMTFCPCCGRYQSLILYKNFTGQKPNIGECIDCAVINRFEGGDE